MNRKFILFALFSLTCLLFSPAANADDIRWGGRAGVFSDPTSAFVGGEALINVINDSWFFNPNLEYVFVDNGNLWAFNFDFHYDLNVDAPVYFWVGGGPAILHRTFDFPRNRDSQTDFGLDLLFGVGFPLHNSRVIPYVQPKVVLSDNSAFSLAFGLRF
jgi:hypothetical protein